MVEGLVGLGIIAGAVALGRSDSAGLGAKPQWKVPGCLIMVGTTRMYHGEKTFAFSRSGWTEARNYSWKLARSHGNPMVLVDVRCERGRIPVYQCQREGDRVRCALEGSSGKTPVTGRLR